VTRRAARDVAHGKVELDARHGNRVALRRNARERLARRSEYGDRPAREQRAIASDVIAAVMRNQM
jgi:hypothetical protein